MTRAWPIFVCVCLLGAGVAARASAQDVGAISLQRFAPAAAPDNYVVTERALSLRHLELSIAGIVDYARDPLIGEVDGDETAIIPDRLGGELMLAFGLFDRLELGVAVPATLAQRSAVNGLDTAASLADLRILPKLLLIEAGLLSIGIRVPFELPTGDERRFSGHPGLRIVPTLIVSLEIERFGAALNAGYRWRKESVEIATGDTVLVIDDEFVGSLGLHVEAVKDWFDIIADASFTVGRDELGELDNDAIWSEVYLALRLWLGEHVAATVGGGPGLSEGPGTPAYRVFFNLGTVATLAAAPPPPDRDRDRFPDARDRCPTQPEDYDGKQDGDGCPDFDPPKDSDGDGLNDSLDRCPSEAEDKDGFEDANGCPDPDNDADGVLDGADRCPAASEDQDGFQDDDGCPDEDNDGDGMLDPVDLCATEAETKNGFEDDDGCPDAIPEAVKRFEGTLQGIVFALNKAEIRPPSRPTLVAVAQAMKSYPSLRVRVRGHTDNRGSSTRNQQLSLDRAQAVKDFLVAEGVAADRIAVEGLGDREPIDTNRTPKGRANNRRIEFRIDSP
jgi:outer membrane protein OmpA-like peptidoglycan-associated protein